MPRSTWQAYNDTHPDKPLTNPRNGAAGTLMQKDAKAAAEAGRLLRFFAFGAERERPGHPTRSTPRRSASSSSTRRSAKRRGGHRGDPRDRRAPRQARLRHRRRRRAPARARRLRGRGLQQRRAARRDRLQVPARGEADQAAGGRVAGRQGRADRAAREGQAGVRRRRHRREHHLAQPAPDPRARPAHRRHGRRRPARRRHPVRGPLDPRGSRRHREGHRAADALPVVQHRTGDPRHRRGALVPEPAVPSADHAPADALGVATGGRHGGRRRRLDREARRGRRTEDPRRLLHLDRREVDDLRAHGRGVGQEHGGLDRALEGSGLTPGAVRLRDPDGIRRHGQALLPGGLREHRGRRRRHRRGAGRDPRHRRQGRRERRRVLRPPRGRSKRSRRCAPTASTSTSTTRTAPSTSPRRPTRR